MTTNDQLVKRFRFPLFFEVIVWGIYVCMYKYSWFLEMARLPNPQHDNFPHPQLIIYAICMTLYTIPFYRWLAPTLLLAKKYWWLVLAVVLHFGVLLKINNWIVTGIFSSLHHNGPIAHFYDQQFSIARYRLFTPFGWSPNTLFTDLLAFMAVAFMRYAFENEKKKHLLEKDNLVLQLESLKAQLHPHFLFNTLNSIYGMSLTGSKDTPAFILRLSDMMRYVLYDCQHNHVPLEKDIAFLGNYIEMEKKRYPDADISFTISGEPEGKTIAPLLFIQFVENSFKHGAHRISEKGFIHGSLDILNDRLEFHLRNDYLAAPQMGPKQMGGVGIENVKKRLQLYYPGQHELRIDKENSTFEVTLIISF